MMRDEDIEPELRTWNILIDGYCQSGDCDTALNLKKEMEGVELTPDAFTGTSLISGFAKQGMLICSSMTKDYHILPGSEHQSAVGIKRSDYLRQHPLPLPKPLSPNAPLSSPNLRCPRRPLRRPSRPFTSSVFLPPNPISAAPPNLHRPTQSPPPTSSTPTQSPPLLHLAAFSAAPAALSSRHHLFNGLPDGEMVDMVNLAEEALQRHKSRFTSDTNMDKEVHGATRLLRMLN
ncbi:hypothetical protein Droror1_Dr00011622 [Drosera rotundifolia]